ncbi:MAG TPA: amino acid ABC transporter permease, partial [Tetragenococcus sp.]|nr:amino acid ABC transporter permease [Tetragenococcus sp.]
QIFIFYFGISAVIRIPTIYIGDVNLARLIPGCIALSINSSAYVAEIIRSGIQAVDKGQSEAGYSLGMSKKLTMREIILPQAIRNILPALGNEFISMVKETSLLSIIAVSELMFVADTVKAATYKTMEALLIAAVIYFIITGVVTLLVGKMEKKFSKSR